MKKAFSKYPEVVLADATHQTNILGFPLFVMLVIDGNGESEVACAFLVLNEQALLLSKMIQLFKARNPK